MTYLSDRRRKRTYWNIALGVAAFMLFIYFWVPFKSTAYAVIEPFIIGYARTKGAVRIVPSFVGTYMTMHKTLYDRNVQLEKEIERLENKSAEQEARKEEETKVSLDRSGDPSAVIVLYPIMGDIAHLYSTIVLSKGYKDGIEKNSIVYVRGRQAVCEIVDLHDRTSLCELLSKGGRMTEAVVGDGSLSITLSGAGGGDYRADLPKGTKIQEGETIRLRSNPHFILGSVVEVMDDEQATMARVYVRGAYNPVDSSTFYLDAAYVR